MSIPPSAYRTFIAYVEDLPGVLNRITSLLRRRNYNIVSLTVGRTERPGTSRMTIVVEADEDAASRIEANLYKLVNVLWVEDTTRAATLVRELALVKVKADASTRGEVMKLCEVFRARVVDVGPEALVAEITGAAEKIRRPGGRAASLRRRRDGAHGGGGDAAKRRGDRRGPRSAGPDDAGRREGCVTSKGPGPWRQFFYDKDCDLSLIRRKKVAILGYGSQGHAHALNLHESGVEVRVGLPATSKSVAKAKAAGLRVATVAEAAAWADVVMILVPDTAQAALYASEVAPHLGPGKTLMFAHGFNIRFGTITPRPDVDVSMIAPKGPGHRVRETYQARPGRARARRRAPGRERYGARAGAARTPPASARRARASSETTFAEETETDLFGEQAVLCGGVSALVKAGFETLVEAGYQPEVAYFECLHELKLIVDLMYRGGLRYMRYSISDTAEYGDYVSGPRVVDNRTRETMRKLLDEIQSGAFAREWIEENENGRPWFEAQRGKEHDAPLEQSWAKSSAR